MPAGRQRRRRPSGDRRRLELRRELVERERAPEVGRRRQPGAAALAREAADDHARQLVLPRRVVEHGEDQARRVGIGAVHQPPPEVALLGAELERRAGVGEAAAQDLLRLVEAARAIGDAVDALQDVEPVDHRRRRPDVRRDVDRAEHLRLGPAVARQRLDRGELAHVEVGARRPELALDAAFDERRQAAEHRVARRRRQREAGLVRRREHVGGEAVAAVRRSSARGGK